MGLRWIFVSCPPSQWPPFVKDPKGEGRGIIEIIENLEKGFDFMFFSKLELI
jgi:hypothetical protein